VLKASQSRPVPLFGASHIFWRFSVRDWRRQRIERARARRRVWSGLGRFWRS